MSLPNLFNALIGWEQPISLVKTIYTEISFGQHGEEEQETPFMAVVQPLKPFAISLKPVELRAFEWIMVHIRDNLPVILNNGDKILWSGKYFKIMQINNYSNFTLKTQETPIVNTQSYGYIEYHACEININEII